MITITGTVGLDVGLGFGAAAVRSPYRISDYLFVLRIGIEDGVGIHDCDWPHQQTVGLEIVR
jgi:hypothetical protein